MRLLFVVQRYGPEVAGGAEAHCREFATRLAARGHEVEVLTTCALGYVDWANVYPAGTGVLDGVLVHRLPVARARDPYLFGELNARVVPARGPVPLHLQVEWMRMQGPDVPALRGWLEQRAGSFDCVVFFTYLYFTTWMGLRSAAGLAPTVLHPTVHDEPPLALPLFDTMFRLPAAFAFSTEEEALLVLRRFRLRRPSGVIGVGVALPGEADDASFRETSGLGDRPYLLYLGRVDPAKASDELFGFFAAYKQRHPGPLALAYVGEVVRPLPPHPDVVATGFVGEAARRGAIAGAVALVQPSYFESFSMVLAEAWAQARPALVQGASPVLAGQARRSGGGLPYRGFAEFEAALDLLLEDPRARSSLGAAGRAYVESRYSWDAVLGRYERLLERARRLPA